MTLTTTRLKLCSYVQDDFADYAAFLASDRSAMMDGPHDVGVAWKYFATDASAQTLTGHGCFTLWRDADRIGFAGIISPPDFPEPELGWGLYDGYEGQGFATEAATAILSHMFATTTDESFVSYIDADNARSIAVAQRIGGVLDPNGVTPDGWNSLVYRHHKPGAPS